VDFGEAQVVVAGEAVTASVFVLTLPHSGAFFVAAFPAECTETSQDGHARAFAHLGGVPTRIRYDNSRIAVATIVGQRGRTPTREFLRLQSHFLFGHHFCRVRRPNEKGHVEAMVGYARRTFLVPVPQADSWEALNAELTRRCEGDLPRRVRGESGTKAAQIGRE
jgi:transposase